MTASYEVRDGIAVVAMDNPPVNSLGLGNRRFIAESVSRAQDDPAIRAIVLTGQGRAFCGGADIREFNKPEATTAPDLVDVIRLVEGCSKPVVAAIHGVVMGGGLELAMGCHYRVVQGGTQVALPEVRIGILPGATGTQRLPRLIGLEAALNMIVTGDTVMSDVLAAMPSQKLFHRIVPDDVVSAAIELAHARADVRPLPRSRDLKVEHPNAEAYLQFARNMVAASSRNYPAPLRCLDCVAQSVRLGFDAAVDYERAAVTELVWTPESAALRNAFFAERAASKIPDVPEDTPRRAIQAVGVIGAGTMGGGISMNFLNAGIPVKILEMKQEALDRGIATIKKNYEAQVKKGKLKQDKYEQRMALLSTTLDYNDLKDADLIIEAVFEELGVKEKVFRELDRVAKPGAILASNTSTLDVDKIAAFTQRPQDVVGMHFFSPANVMKLLEVVRGKETAKDVLATVMSTAKKIKKTAVVSGVCDGFIGNRMIEQYSRQAGFLLDEGATPQQVDKAIEKFGFAMGPFRMGHVADGEVRRKEAGVAPRQITDEEIVQRLVYALVNEGARILEDGIASRSGDIDMVYLTGYGFPIWRGGPMHYASQVGLYNVAESMKRFARNPRDDASFWQPAALIRKLVAEGKSFS
ncbi:3-hydroxyacyl-CoA dehydrogenase NAD-binding domain-containing protein [Variovorax sp. J2P1-59]|uniref:3-hydroxyacyl-CoA dehydrogenase NAD-binding domain-containing protein n=1 Tax=Variovorax flavidus TaxID=3053501 RepID=UPI0025761A41|nr:3-hydroxyacyl-CoA dehydrogenase NAD-binding domain-containing protein [Variovorax sp. J2P1-59]MDM0075981.1 3-hydroxyacyl-CoA dehydrogenase NAD-binding domain-containing protein [Variovorax sp. J2P1-59]